MTHFQNRQSAVAVTKRSTVVDHPTNEQFKQLEADLWSAADNLRANSDLKSSEYATPVLGLIFLKFADDNYRRHEADIIAEYQELKGTRRERKLSDIAIEKCGFYLPDHARYGYLLDLPEEKNIAKALKRGDEGHRGIQAGTRKAFCPKTSTSDSRATRRQRTFRISC
jgi:hypothetical protein